MRLDWKIRAGYLKDVFPVPLPFIPGWDVSGVVEAVGSVVTKFKKGDEVYARPDVARSGKGAYAEYVVVKESEAALKPKSIDHVHAADIPVVALTAWQALFDTAALSKGQRILIHGTRRTTNSGTQNNRDCADRKPRSRASRWAE